MKKLKYIVLSFLMLAVSVNAQEADTLVATAEDQTIDLAYQKMNTQRFVGAADVVTSEQLLRSSEYQADLALPGLASGLFATKGAANPGLSWTTLKVRGNSRGGTNDAPLIVVDGIPDRSIDNLPIESIESITVLKDITAKMLYGSQAANGVILVTTKRGFISPKKLTFSVEAGIKKPTFVPEYLDAAEYAKVFNQSQINDGVDPSGVRYSQEDIDAYANGTNPLLYPNQDYNALLKNLTDFQRANAILRGGNEKTKYFLNMEYLREKGIEAVGQGDAFNQLNLVSNLDYEVNDIISVAVDLSTRIGLHSNSRVGGSALYEAVSTHRPNEYPFCATTDGSLNTDSIAYRTTEGSQIYGDLLRSGYEKSQNFQTQTTMALNFDLDQYVKGLSASVKLGFDAYNTITKGKQLGYATYQIVPTDSVIDFVKVGEDEIKSTEQRFADDFTRNVAGYGNIKYNNSFGAHDILVDANYSLRQFASKSTVDYGSISQDNKGINAGLRANYMYDDKYVLELNGSYMGSDRFAAGNRYKPFGAVGAAWILSEEDFLADADALSHLKLKASYGTMGYDKELTYYTYQEQYLIAGNFQAGTLNGTTVNGARISQYAADMTFETATELNVGVEAAFFNNRLTLEGNYFNELREDMPIEAKASVPGYLASSKVYKNYNSVRNSGADFKINYADNAGDFYYAIGGNVLYSKSIYEKYDENPAFKHQKREGTATDAYIGLNALGLYTEDDFNADGTTKDGVISTYDVTLQPGDIKYENLITDDLKDKQIDWNDAYENGNTYPRFYYSLNLNLAYKGFELYALGQGVACVDKFMTSNYFLNYGEKKYSTMIYADDYPRLTADQTGGNNFRGSTYWKEDGSYFKLRTVELSYTLPSKASERISADKVKIFVRGTDLLTLSSIKTVDPEDVEAGLSKYPLYTTGSIGAKITF